MDCWGPLFEGARQPQSAGGRRGGSSKSWRSKAPATKRSYKDKLLVMLKLNPETVALEAGFSRDVRNIGTWGTGDLELCLRGLADLPRAMPLLERSYSES